MFLRWILAAMSKVKIRAEDMLWSLAVRERDNYTCRRCGGHHTSPKGLHAHHIFTRSRKSTRLDVNNGVTLDFGCHMWAHRNPLEFHEWIRDDIGAEKYDALQARSRKLAK